MMKDFKWKWQDTLIVILLSVIGKFMPKIRDNYFTGVRYSWLISRRIKA
ncbi:hypothetical protein HQN87_27125 [Paenibacillus tritici]|uniref:Uncharacterized protein n=1 Tax=Paenibacillus tritici TaxID=1873425 RepID=A0ABX2DWB2_9BACL|nr:hypothetical protein [Paenibacillus tritici]NQX49001.1 hypothetical protein [Paenibacillus tritici]QUL54226.1 hypothetical protein KDC22_28590 [Paenibacillus tritici]